MGNKQWQGAPLSSADGILFAGPVRASTNTTDITGMWWKPAESGWGVNVTLQNDFAFLSSTSTRQGAPRFGTPLKPSIAGSSAQEMLLWDQAQKSAKITRQN